MDDVLGDFVTLQRGNTYKSRLLGQPGPVLLGLASIQRDGGFRRDKLRTYGGESPGKLLVYPGEIYVSLKDVTQAGDLLGAVARLPDDVYVGRLTQDTVKLIVDWGRIDRDYLYWILRSPQYRQYCRARAIGTTNLALRREDLLAFAVPAATPTRLKLAELLQAIDDKIEVNRTMSRTLGEMAQAIFQSWFVDFDGHTDLAPSELGPIPRGWHVGRISELARLNPEVWKKTTAPPYVDYIDLKSVKHGRISQVRRIVYADAPSRARRRLAHGDTVIGTVRPANRSFGLIMEPPASVFG